MFSDILPLKFQFQTRFSLSLLHHGRCSP
jgi:hypothetical protein